MSKSVQYFQERLKQALFVFMLLLAFSLDFASTANAATTFDTNTGTDERGGSVNIGATVAFLVLPSNTVQVGNGMHPSVAPNTVGPLSIPDTVTHNGISYSVTSIGNGAFLNASNLISITIPDTVTSIGDSAFHSATSLTSVTMPNVTHIGDNAFYATFHLAFVTMPNVTSIGNSAFSDATTLTSVNMPNVTSIGNSAFSNATSLKSVTMPNVTNIGDSAFANATSLTSITISSNVTVGANAFVGTPFETALGTAATTLAPGTYTITNNNIFTFTPSAPQNTTRQDYPDAEGTSIALIDNLAAVADIHSNIESIRFFSVLFSDTVGIGTNNSREAIRVFESVLRLDQAAAVSSIGIGSGYSAASNIISYLSQSGFSLSSTGGQVPAVVQVSEVIQGGMAAGSDVVFDVIDEKIKNGLALWLSPMYKYSIVSGISVGAFKHGYESSLGGLSLGGDYTFDNAFRIGLAFNLGTGYTESTGDLSSTTSNFDFWGLSAYSAYYKENFSLMADVGFNSISGELNQEVPAILGSSNLEADTRSMV